MTECVLKKQEHFEIKHKGLLKEDFVLKYLLLYGVRAFRLKYIFSCVTNTTVDFIILFAAFVVLLYFFCILIFHISHILSTILQILFKVTFATVCLSDHVRNHVISA